jgi:hypothetical protein
MYQLQQRVWVKSEGILATIEERGWMPTAQGRRAFYIVGWTTPKPMGGAYHTLLTGSDNLRAADWGCDGCSRYLPGYPYATAPDGPDGRLQFCFLCAAPQVVGYAY